MHHEMLYMLLYQTATNTICDCELSPRLETPLSSYTSIINPGKDQLSKGRHLNKQMIYSVCVL